MDLDPTLTIRTRGRAAEPLEVSFERDLTPADMALLAEPRATAQPKGLKAVRAGHHAVAMALASGKKPGEVAALTGYSPSRISVLQSDPTFINLLEFYRENANLAYVNLHERLSRVSHTALEILEERLEDNPDAMTEDTLLDVAKLGADRTGHGPQSRNLHVHANVGDLADRLRRGRERAQAQAENQKRALPQGEAREAIPASAGVIEGTYTDVEPS